MNFENIIEVENISKIYSQNGEIEEALKNVSFSVAKGESLGIIGKNGSGKSTLLKILAGITKPTEGCAKLYGNSACILDYGGGFHPDLSGKKNIQFAGNLLGFSFKQYSEKLPEIIEFSELSNSILNRPVKTYSNGQYMRLAFSIYAHLPFNLLLIDEVLGVGDNQFIEKSISKIKELQHGGLSILFASHDNSILLEAFENCILINEGKVIGKSKTKEILETYKKSTNRLYNSHIGHIYQPIQIENYLIVNSAFFISQKTSFSRSQKIEFGLKFIPNQIPTLDFVLQISTINQEILTDCNIYRENFEEISYIDKKEYILSFTLPELFLNVGTYYISFSLGNRVKEIFLLRNVLKFEIYPDSWEEKKPWNEGFQKFPLKPVLDFKIEEV